MSIYIWHSCNCLISDLGEGSITEMTVGVKRIALLRRGNTVLAFTALCPHAGAPLCEGWVDAQGRVVCPLHKYRFDPVTGRNTTGEGYRLFRYPVEIRDGLVWVGFVE